MTLIYLDNLEILLTIVHVINNKINHPYYESTTNCVLWNAKSECQGWFHLHFPS